MKSSLLLLLTLCTIIVGSPCNISARNPKAHCIEPEVPLQLKSALTQRKVSQIKSPKNWQDVCLQSKNAVYQIISYVSLPDFEEPFKTPDRTMSLGSGFCISPDGYVLTNFHVIAFAHVIMIRLASLGQEIFEIEYVSGCPERDIALLKLTKESLDRLKNLLKVNEIPYLALGNSDEVKEAQEIMTIGYPLGQENFKSSIGIFSGRETTEVGECIQTTAPVNPGNSGGAFVDQKGNVIGICVLKERDAEGIGYLIPINSVTAMLSAFFQYPIIRCQRLGIIIRPTNDETLEHLNLHNTEGVYLARIIKGSVAKKLGLKAGDLITEIDELPLDKHGYLESPWTHAKITIFNYLQRLPFGTNIKLKVFRDGNFHTFIHTIEPRQKNAIDYLYPWIEDVPDYEVIGGLVICQFSLNHLRNIEIMHANRGDLLHKSSIMAKYFKEEHQLEPRLCITTVLPDSEAHRSQVFDGSDLIIKTVNGHPVKTIKDLHDAIKTSQLNNRTVIDGHLVIETEGGTLVALSKDKIVKQEKILSQRYHYKPSQLIEVLIK